MKDFKELNQPKSGAYGICDCPNPCKVHKPDDNPRGRLENILTIFAHHILKDVAVQTHTDFEKHLTPIIKKHLKLFYIELQSEYERGKAEGMRGSKATKIAIDKIKEEAYERGRAEKDIAMVREYEKGYRTGKADGQNITAMALDKKVLEEFNQELHTESSDLLKLIQKTARQEERKRITEWAEKQKKYPEERMVEEDGGINFHADTQEHGYDQALKDLLNFLKD